VAVHSIHKATSKDGHKQGRGFYRGEVVCYLNVVVLRNAYMNVHQASREGIATGEIAKCPMASIDGEFVEPGGKVSFDGVELSFNPKSVHLFVDADGYAVRYAEEITILGHRGYARGKIEYYAEDNAPAKFGCAATSVKFKA
jgi:hypothetical protein